MALGVGAIAGGQIIRGRNNALFFKTPAGADAFDYRVALQRHTEAIKRRPERWLAWS